MSFPLTVPLAVVLIAGLAVNWRVLGQSRTRLGVGLLLTVVGATIYAVVNIKAIASVVTEITVPGITTLIKDLALLTPLAGMVLFWSELRRLSRPQWAMIIVLLIGAVGYRVIAWNRVREQCVDSAVGIAFDNCALRDVPYALGEAGVLVALTAAVLVTAWLLRRGMDWKSVPGRSVTVLVMAALVLAAWAVVAAVGVADTFENGELGPAQFVLRPVLSILGAVLLVMATLMTPIAMLWQKASFRERTQTISEALSTKTRAPDLPAGNPVTALMDHLGLALERDGQCLTNAVKDKDADLLAAWLVGEDTADFGIPRYEPIWRQRIWLLRTADTMKGKVDGQE